MEIEILESKARIELSPVLADHIWLVERAQNTIAQVLNIGLPLQNTPLFKQVAINLLTRIWNELRAITSLCQHGYPLQAFSVATVVYEATFTIASINSDEAEAEKWFAHEIEKDSFLKARSLTEKGLKNLGGQEALQSLQMWLNLYKDLCMGKHINPKGQRYEGYEVDSDGNITFAYGPSTTHDAVKKAWWIIHVVVRLTCLALRSYEGACLTDEHKPLAINLIEQLEKARTEIGEEAVQLLSK